MRKVLLISALIIACPALAQEESAATNGLYPKEDHEFYVPSGKTRSIGYLWGGLKTADCTFWNVKDIDARVTQQPKNGTVQLVEDNMVVSYKPDHPGHKCNGKRVVALKINYKSADKFVGVDEFEMFILWPNSKASEKHVTVNVK
jgi:hypothetical protein